MAGIVYRLFMAALRYTFLAGFVMALLPLNAGSSGFKIGFLIDSYQEQRYEIDRSLMEARAKADGNELLFATAGGDHDRQVGKVRELLQAGAQVLVIQAVEPSRAHELVRPAREKGIPVVAYDRPLDAPGVRLKVMHDDREVGRLQARAALSRVAAGTPVRALICAGPQGGAVSDAVTAGNLEVLRGAGVKQIEVRYHRGWSEDECKATTLRKLHRDGRGIDVVLANNSSLIAGAILALEAQAPSQKAFTAGADGNTQECRLVREGRLSYGVLKPIPPLVEAAYSGAVRLAKGLEPQTAQRVRGIPSVTVPVKGYGSAELGAVYASDALPGYEKVRQACGL